MEIIDISMSLEDGMVIYPGDAKFKRTDIVSFDKKGVRLSKIELGSHTGTHIDAPAHFLKKGKTIDKVSLDSLVGKGKVCEFSVKAIGEKELKECGIKKGDIVLLKTQNWELGTKKFSEDFAYLDESGADYLVKKGIKAVGIDYLSIGEFHKGREVHKKLLGNNIPIIEGLNLKTVNPGPYVIYCLPLKIKGAEGAPARCILVSP